MEQATMNRFAICLVACLLILTGCAKKRRQAAVPARTPAATGAPASSPGSIHRTPPETPAPPVGSTERGVASWYGHPYHGRAAADGEIYDMETLVAAHRTLPFQTRVRVRNLNNDRSVEVRIIDRGPFVGGRVIDVSHAAAVEIGLIGPGTAPVEITIVGDPVNPEPALFAVQVGAFRDKGNADRAEQSMRETYGASKAVMRAGEPPVWRILAGRETSQQAAEELAARIRAEQNEPQAFVVRLDP